MNIKCPQCDFENEEGNKFCKNCNVPLSKQEYSEDNPYIKKNEKEDQPSELISDEENEIRNKIEKEERIREEVRAEIEQEKEDMKEPSSRTGGNKKGIKQLLGLIGSAVLFLGVFAPIVSIPMMGNMNYFQNGEGDGTIVLILAVISFIFVLLKMFPLLWFTGLSSMAIMAFTFINFQMRLVNTKTQMETELAGNPFRGLADMAMQSVQIQWGWALLIIGAVLLIASAAIGDK